MYTTKTVLRCLTFAARHSSRQSSAFFKDLFNTLVSVLWSHPAGVFNYSHAQPRVSSSSYRRLPEKFSFLVSTCSWNVSLKRCISKNHAPTLKLFLSISVFTTLSIYLAETQTVQNSLYAQVEWFHSKSIRLDSLERDTHTSIVEKSWTITCSLTSNFVMRKSRFQLIGICVWIYSFRKQI